MNSRLNKRVGPLTKEERDQHNELMHSLRSRIKEIREKEK
jgi:hypothetical protein